MDYREHFEKATGWKCIVHDDEIEPSSPPIVEYFKFPEGIKQHATQYFKAHTTYLSQRLADTEAKAENRLGIIQSEWDNVIRLSSALKEIRERLEYGEQSENDTDCIKIASTALSPNTGDVEFEVAPIREPIPPAPDEDSTRSDDG